MTRKSTTGKPARITALGGFANALLHRRNPVPRDRAAENIVDELDSLPARQRLQLDPAQPELPWPPVCFLCLPSASALRANRFAVGNFGRMDHQIDVIALAELGDHDFHVLLAGTAEQELLGLRIATEAQCEVLFEDLVNGDADAVFVGAGLGLDGKGDRRLGNVAPADRKRLAFLSPSVSPVVVSFSLAIAADVTRVQLLNLRCVLTLYNVQVLESFLRAAMEIGQRRVVLQNAGHHLEIDDAAGERIRQRLEHEYRERFGTRTLLRSIAFARVIGALWPCTCRAPRGDGKISATRLSSASLPILCSAELAAPGKSAAAPRLRAGL